MKRYLKNLLSALLGNNPYRAERDEIARERAEHATIEPHNRICSNEQLIRLELVRVRARFRTRDIIRYIAALKLGRIGLIGIDRNGDKGDIQTCQQFAPTRGLRA